MKLREYYKKNPFVIEIGENGLKFVPFKSVRSECLNFSLQNSKTGKVIAFNFPVELTCDHKCNCYREKACYACGGCYQFAMNQAIYSENLHFFLTHSSEEFVKRVVAFIRRRRSRHLFRWFTCGDILNKRFLACMVAVAKECPDVKFWVYTKKYMIVNAWTEENGIEAMPENLTIIFSHWRNDDGSFFPMYNPFNYPTSEFIPMGCEDELKNVNHICPCSDPGTMEHCATCKTPCYGLKRGESMALVEHSTSRTKERDAKIKEMKKKGVKVVLIDFLKSFVA